MNQRVLGIAYGYIVCFGALILFGYGLVTLVPTRGPLAERLSPIEVSVFTTDTIATDTMATDSPALSVYDRAAELQNLKASQRAFEDAREVLDRERARLADLRMNLHLIQRVLMLLFASVVFVFHWRWMRRLTMAI